MKTEKHDYADLCDLFAANMKRAADLGLSELENGGAAFMAALEDLETVPNSLDAVVDFSARMLEAKDEIESDDDLSYCQRVSGKVGAYQLLINYLMLVTDGLTKTRPGAMIVLGPECVAFLVKTFIPFEGWPE